MSSARLSLSIGKRQKCGTKSGASLELDRFFQPTLYGRFYVAICFPNIVIDNTSTRFISCISIG